MATKVIVALEDDLEGGPAAETLRFGIGGSEYEIDLNEKNAARLRKQLAPFVENARRAGRGQRRAVRTAASRRRSRDIRSWAQKQGIALSERGRIPASVVDQYDASSRRGSRLSARVTATGPLPLPRRAGRLRARHGRWAMAPYAGDGHRIVQRTPACSAIGGLAAPQSTPAMTRRYWPHSADGSGETPFGVVAPGPCKRPPASGCAASGPGGRLLLVAAELLAHRGQRLVGEQVELARGEP
jgi:hypothetical protein